MLSASGRKQANMSAYRSVSFNHRRDFEFSGKSSFPYLIINLSDFSIIARLIRGSHRSYVISDIDSEVKKAAKKVMRYFSGRKCRVLSAEFYECNIAFN